MKTMLCPSCQNFRPANNAPCPLCYAPLPLAGGDASSFANTWGNQRQAPSWDELAASQSERDTSGQLSFNQSSWQDLPAEQQLPFAGSQAGASDNAFWSHAAEPGKNGADASPVEKQGPPSLLPVPYEGKSSSRMQAVVPMPTGFPTIETGIQPVNPLLPALPDENLEVPIRVPPMYTKPRPIIPRYRAISGLISFIIVSLLLCGGSGYYAHTTGKLNFLYQLLGVYTPPTLASSAQNVLPVPPLQTTQGPVANIVPSAALGNKVDANTGQVAQYVNQFVAGQTIYLTCSVLSTVKAGTLTLKWYMNKNLYLTKLLDFTDPQNSNTLVYQMVYPQPSEGMVEIYWNDQLAQSMLFVVEPAA